MAGVDLLSKLELESERNLLHYYAMYSSLALHYYTTMTYMVCMKSALHILLQIVSDPLYLVVC